MAMAIALGIGAVCSLRLHNHNIWGIWVQYNDFSRGDVKKFEMW